MSKSTIVVAKPLYPEGDVKVAEPLAEPVAEALVVGDGTAVGGAAVAGEPVGATAMRGAICVAFCPEHAVADGIARMPTTRLRYARFTRFLKERARSANILTPRMRGEHGANPYQVVENERGKL